MLDTDRLFARVELPQATRKDARRSDDQHRRRWLRAPARNLVEVDMAAQESWEIGKFLTLAEGGQFTGMACIIGDDGLVANVGSIPRFTKRIQSMVALLTIFSVGLCAVFSRQNSISRCQIGSSPLRSEYHTRAAQSAPPDVPLMPTHSNSSLPSASSSPLSTPAVKAV